MWPPALFVPGTQHMCAALSSSTVFMMHLTFSTAARDCSPAAMCPPCIHHLLFWGLSLLPQCGLSVFHAPSIIPFHPACNSNKTGQCNACPGSGKQPNIAVFVSGVLTPSAHLGYARPAAHLQHVWRKLSSWQRCRMLCIKCLIGLPCRSMLCWHPIRLVAATQAHWGGLPQSRWGALRAPRQPPSSHALHRGAASG